MNQSEYERTRSKLTAPSYQTEAQNRARIGLDLVEHLERRLLDLGKSPWSEGDEPPKKISPSAVVELGGANPEKRPQIDLVHATDEAVDEFLASHSVSFRRMDGSGLLVLVDDERGNGRTQTDADRWVVVDPLNHTAEFVTEPAEVRS